MCAGFEISKIDCIKIKDKDRSGCIQSSPPVY